jgi:hypothetical protein
VIEDLRTKEKIQLSFEILIFRNGLPDRDADSRISVAITFPFISSNIPAAPAYGVYISQLKRYSRACDQYSDFLERAQLLTQKLLKQGYNKPAVLLIRIVKSDKSFVGDRGSTYKGKDPALSVFSNC